MICFGKFRQVIWKCGLIGLVIAENRVIVSNNMERTANSGFQAATHLCTLRYRQILKEIILTNKQIKMQRQKHEISNILFIDIETCTKRRNFFELDFSMQSLWKKKCASLLKVDSIDDHQANLYYTDKAAIYAEFGKIVCISLGYLHKIADGSFEFRKKSFYGKDEVSILCRFAELIAKISSMKNILFCGHNIREFDIPFISRRMLVNGIEIPKVMDLSFKKPWEYNHILDTLQMWKFGDYKSYCSLDLLCNLMRIESPKTYFHGQMVSALYYQNRLQAIRKYCESDVLATAKLFLKLNNVPAQIHHKNYLKKVS